ncbi:MAG: hypothetical protein ACSLFP_11435 [Acidimicrobiales bacterium]
MALRRASLVGAVVAALALTLLSTSPARSQTADGPWAGSRITSPASTTDPTPEITADFFLAYNNTTTNRVRAVTEVTPPGGLPAGCVTTLGGTGGPTTLTREEGNRHPSTASLATSCNGTYQVRITATHQGRSCAPVVGCSNWANTDVTHTLSGTVAISAPAPSPTAATATASERSVEVTWTPVVGAPPDFLGYGIERVSANGTRATIASIDDPTAASFTDDDPPAEGGATTYRVFGRRSGPSGEVQSTGSPATVDVAATPEQPGEPGTGPGTTPGSTPGTTPGSTPGAPPGVSTPGGQNPSISGGPGSTVRVPRVGTPSRSFFPPLLTPPVNQEDAGFDEALPFDLDDEEPGADEAILPDDDLAASTSFGEVAGRGMVIPFATALLLAVWAFHLRYLARAARPVEGGYEHGYE